MKKNYFKPSLKVVEIKSSSILNGGSQYRNYNTNSGIQAPTSDQGYSGEVRSRQARFSDWDEE